MSNINRFIIVFIYHIFYIVGRVTRPIYCVINNYLYIVVMIILYCIITGLCPCAIRD